MKIFRALALNYFLLFVLGITTVSATTYDGSSSVYYNNFHAVFHNNNDALGRAYFTKGFTILPDATGKLSVSTPMYGVIDLRMTGTLWLGTDIILDSGVTFSRGGNIWGNNHTIFLTGNLTLTNTTNLILKFINNTIVDGQGHDLILGKYSQLLVDGGVTVTFKNMTIKNTLNTIGCPPIRCMDWYSKACFDNTTLSFNDDFAFKNGQIFIHNDVDITGTSKFSYRSVRPSYITPHANLIFDPQTTFEFYPSTTDNALIQMADKTSAIIFDDSTLQTTHTGIRLTKGSLYFDNKVTLSSADNTACYGFGTHISQNYDSSVGDVAWSPDGRYLAVGGDSGIKVYFFNGYSMTLVSSLGSGQKAAWSPDGQYLAVVGLYTQVQVYSFNGFSLNLIAGASYFVASSVAWSPNGKYLAVGGNNNPSDLSVYEWNGSSLTFIDGVFYGIWSETWYADIYSVKWSPDGSYLAIGGIYPSSGENLKVYSFDGTSLTIVAAQPYCSDPFTWLNSVAWNPTGEYLAIGGTGASYPNTDCLQLYYFNKTSLHFVTSYEVGNCSAVAWSPDGNILGVGCGLAGEQLQLFSFTGSSLGLLAAASNGDDYGTIYSIDWNPAGTFLAIGGAPGSGYEEIEVYPVYYKFDTSPQGFRTGISFGNSALGSAYDLDVHSLAANRINLYGKLWHDSLNSWVFDSRDSYLSLNRYDSKFKITDADSMNNWKKQHIIKSSQDNTLFVQDNQIWESNTDYNLAPEETFEFMNDLIIPDNQIVQLSSNAVIDGQGHNLILGKYSQLLVDAGITVTFKNMTIKNTHNTISSPPIHCVDSNSKACLDNITLALNDDCAFTIGQIFFHNDVEFTGTSKFSYQSAQSSYITQHSNVIFAPNTTFEYYPVSANNNLIQMADKTSALIFDGSTLQTTHTGIRLTKGSLYFDNKVTLSSTNNTLATLTTVTTENYTQAATSVSLSRDGRYLAVCGRTLAPNTSLIVYSWNGSILAQLDSKNYTTLYPPANTPYFVSWSPNGQYLAVGGEWLVSPDYKFILYSWNGLSLSQIYGFEGGDGFQYAVSWHPSSEYFALVSIDGNWLSILNTSGSFELNEYFDAQTFAVAWSSDGNYVAVGGAEIASNVNIIVYRWNNNDQTLTRVASAAMGTPATDIVYSLAWSPDGRALAAGGIGVSADVAVYSWNGSFLNQIVTKNHGAGAQTVAWSSDGKVLSVGGNNGSSDLILYNWTESSLSPIIQMDFGITASSQSWSSDGKFLAVCGNNGSTDLKIYGFNYTYDTNPQAFYNGISFGNSELGSTYDLDVHALADARINLYGKLWHDSLNSWIFDSRDSYLSLNCYDSKFKITDADSMSNWKKQHIIKSSQDNTIFLQDNQIWEANTDYNLAPEETFEFMNDLIIPDNQLVKLSSNAVIDGQGHNLILGKYAQLLVDGGITVTFKNMTIKNTLNTISCPPIRCMDWYSKACLDNVTLLFNDDCAFRNGQIFVHNDVNITGTSKFSYRSVRPSYITQHSNLIFDPNTTFEFYPSTTDNQLIQMADKTSGIIFDGSTLQTTHTGIRLTKGSVFFDNKVTLSSMDNTMLTTLSYPSISQDYGNTTQSVSWSPDGRFLAVGGGSPTSGKFLQVYQFTGLSLNLIASQDLVGGVIYSVSWSPDGRYLATGQIGGNNFKIYQFTGSSLNLVASQDYGTSINSVSWSPDGKYLAIGGSAPTSGNELQVYQFTGSSLNLVTSQDYGSEILSVQWSPDGRYLAIGGQGPTSGNELQVYQFTGSSLNLVVSQNYGTFIYSVTWRSDGRFLAVGGYNPTSGNELQVYQFNGSSLNLAASQDFNGLIYPVSWSPDGRYLAIGGDDPISRDELQIYQFTGSGLSLVASQSYGLYNIYSVSWSPDGRFLAIGGITISGNELQVCPVLYSFDTSPQDFSNGIIFGNSALGATHDLDVNVLAGARVNVNGNCFYDNVS